MTIIPRKVILLIAPFALVLGACTSMADPAPPPTAPAATDPPPPTEPVATPTEAVIDAEPDGGEPTATEEGVIEITPLGGEPESVDEGGIAALSGGWRVTHFEGAMMCGTPEEGAEPDMVIPASAEESILITFSENGETLTADGFGQEDAGDEGRVPVEMARVSEATGQSVYEGIVTVQEGFVLNYTLTLFTDGDPRITGTITSTMQGCDVNRAFEAEPVG